MDGLQGFSWHELTPPLTSAWCILHSESRLMAYGIIAHGAKGILYWGTEVGAQGSPFRQSPWPWPVNWMPATVPDRERATTVRVSLTPPAGSRKEPGRETAGTARRSRVAGRAGERG